MADTFLVCTYCTRCSCQQHLLPRLIIRTQSHKKTPSSFLLLLPASLVLPPSFLIYTLFLSLVFLTPPSSSCSPQAVQEEVSIPGAFVKLNYLSTRAAGYLSLLRILLTPPSPSSPVSPLGGLSKVHVRSSVQGRLYQRWYPAGPGLVHRLVWNKTDVYGQEVWGLTYATGRRNMSHTDLYS